MVLDVKKTNTYHQSNQAQVMNQTAGCHLVHHILLLLLVIMGSTWWYTTQFLMSYLVQ